MSRAQFNVLYNRNLLSILLLLMLLYSFICSPSEATRLYQNNCTLFYSDLEHEILRWHVPTIAVLSVLKFCRIIDSANPCAVCSTTPAADNETNTTVTSSTC